MAARKSIADRFWPQVHKTDSCWLWKGDTSLSGYGRIWYKGRTVRAHRIAWMLNSGELPPTTALVLHKCDTPACVRPDHLFLGTTQDNIRDKVAKRRHAKGETHYNHKLTADDVRAIRASTESNVALARKYGVHNDNIRYVRIRRSWAHIT